MRQNTEAALIAYLNANGIETFADVPSTRPDRFAVVERVGGSSDGFVDTSYLVVDFLAPTRAEAAEFAYGADGLMDGFVATKGIRRVDKGSLAHVTAYDDRAACYEATYNVISQED